MKIGMFGYDDTCVKIYDPEEKDPSKKLIASKDNYNQAGIYLGLAMGAVQKHCGRKTRVFAPKLNKFVAVRLSSRDTADRRPIIKGDIKLKQKQAA